MFATLSRIVLYHVHYYPVLPHANQPCLLTSLQSFVSWQALHLFAFPLLAVITVTVTYAINWQQPIKYKQVRSGNICYNTNFKSALYNVHDVSGAHLSP